MSAKASQDGVDCGIRQPLDIQVAFDVSHSQDPKMIMAMILDGIYDTNFVNIDETRAMPGVASVDRMPLFKEKGQAHD